MSFAWMVDTPIGVLTLVERNGSLTEARFGKCIKQEAVQETPLLLRAARELDEYFKGRRKAFTVPLAPEGTPFQQKCWQALCEIPYGETRTYQQQAQAVENPKACRAVGMANHRNPLPIFIPCHRVVGKSGRLTGYAGGLSMKEALLTLEKEK